MATLSEAAAVVKVVAAATAAVGGTTEAVIVPAAERVLEYCKLQQMRDKHHCRISVGCDGDRDSSGSGSICDGGGDISSGHRVVVKVVILWQFLW